MSDFNELVDVKGRHRARVGWIGEGVEQFVDVDKLTETDEALPDVVEDTSCELCGAEAEDYRCGEHEDESDQLKLQLGAA